MKKVFKNSVFAFVFALAFLFCGAITVSAAPINNTNISNATTTYRAEGDSYYALKGSAEAGTIRLKNKSNGRVNGIVFENYQAAVSVVKCANYNSGEDVCTTWSVYNYNTNPNTTMDALKHGLNLNFKSENLKEANDLTSVNGATLSQLKSVYGVDNTYFVIVQYTAVGAFKKTAFEPDIFRVVFTDTLPGLTVTSINQGNTTRVIVSSGLPLNTIRYFHSSSEQTAEFDFEAKYNESGNGVYFLERAESNPASTNGVFDYTIEINKESGEFYYLEATDLSGANVVYDIANNTSNSGDGVNGTNPEDGNVGNTNVGKIILIALLVLLVLSLVLVIVQRIVDYRKKLY